MLLMILALMLIPTAAISVWHLALSKMSKHTWRVYQITGALGAPVHELSHLVACIAFRLPVHRVALYTPNSADGSLGHVAFSSNPRSLLNNLGMAVQGIAPLIGGTLITTFALKSQDLSEMPQGGMAISKWCASLAAHTLDSVQMLGFGSIGGAVLAITLLVVAMHSIPSWADVRVGAKGFLLVGLSFVFAAAAMEIASSYLILDLQSLIGTAEFWVSWVVKKGIAGAVRVTTLAVVGGLVLVVLPGFLLGMVTRAGQFFRRSKHAGKEE